MNRPPGSSRRVLGAGPALPPAPVAHSPLTVILQCARLTRPPHAGLPSPLNTLRAVEGMLDAMVSSERLDSEVDEAHGVVVYRVRGLDPGAARTRLSLLEREVEAQTSRALARRPMALPRFPMASTREKGACRGRCSLCSSAHSASFTPARSRRSRSDSLGSSRSSSRAASPSSAGSRGRSFRSFGSRRSRSRSSTWHASTRTGSGPPSSRAADGALSAGSARSARAKRLPFAARNR